MLNLQICCLIFTEKTKGPWGFPAEGQHWNSTEFSQEKICKFPHTHKNKTPSESVVCFIINFCYGWLVQVRLVNINIPDIIDGKPSIILGLVWTIILHCHVSAHSDSRIWMAAHTNQLLLLLWGRNRGNCSSGVNCRKCRNTNWTQMKSSHICLIYRVVWTIWCLKSCVW